MRPLAKTLLLRAIALLSVACSDGASPKSYRPPLEGNAKTTPDRCDVPASCFDACYCAGYGVDDCQAQCPAGTGGAEGSGAVGASGGGAGASGSGGGGSSGSGGAGSSGTGGTAAPACTPPLPDSSKAEYSCDPSGGLACNNCSDCRQIIDGSAKQAATDCGVQCGGSRSCAEPCLKNGTTLTDPCSSCLLDFFDCLVQNCLANCLGTTPDACTSCSRTKPSAADSCSTRLESCSGAHSNGA